MKTFFLLSFSFFKQIESIEKNMENIQAKEQMVQFEFNMSELKKDIEKYSVNFSVFFFINS